MLSNWHPKKSIPFTVDVKFKVGIVLSSLTIS